MLHFLAALLSYTVGKNFSHLRAPQLLVDETVVHKSSPADWFQAGSIRIPQGVSIHLSWTSRLLPCPSYCKEYCNEHWGTCISSIMVSSGYMPGSGIAGSYGSSIPSFLRNLQSPYCSPQWLHQFTFLSAVKASSLFSTFFPSFIVCRFLNNGLSDPDQCEVIPQRSFLHFSNNEQH